MNGFVFYVPKLFARSFWILRYFSVRWTVGHKFIIFIGNFLLCDAWALHEFFEVFTVLISAGSTGYSVRLIILRFESVALVFKLKEKLRFFAIFIDKGVN